MSKTGTGWRGWDAEELVLTAGEKQLIWQIRDIRSKLDTKPFQVSVVVIGDVWHIYEGVPRGRVKSRSHG